MKYGTGPLGEPEEEEEAEIVVAKPAAILPSEPPLPVGLLFPGQGSQYMKMMMGVEGIPKVQEMLKSAKDILGWDVMELCKSGPEAKLEETKFCQPVMFIAGMAGIEKLRGDKPEVVDRFQVTAGLSLGEYTALCAAGVFPFEDGLRLVKLRGEAMQDASDSSPQQMVSVLGMGLEKLEQCCNNASKSGACEISVH